MNRRNFLKKAVQVGLLATATVTTATIPKFNTYPDIIYSKDWVIDKGTYLHTLHAKSDNEILHVVEYSDEEYMPDETLRLMFREIKTALDRDK